MAVRS